MRKTITLVKMKSMKETVADMSMFKRMKKRALSIATQHKEVERKAREATLKFEKDAERKAQAYGADDQETQIHYVKTAPRGVQPTLYRWGVAAWSIIGIAVTIGGIFYAIGVLRWVFVGLFIAFILTSLLQPAVNFLNRIMPRGLATATTLIGFIFGFFALIFWIIDSVASQWGILSSQISEGLDGLFDWIANGPLPVNITVEELRHGVMDGLERASKFLQDNAGWVASTALSQASSVFLIGTILVLALFCAIFFLASGKKMWLWALNLLPAKHRRRVHAAATAGWYSFSGYARGTIFVAVSDGFLAGVLLFICQVPLAAPLAVLVTMGAFIPMFGAPITMIIAALVALATKGPTTALIIMIGVALIAQFEGNVLQPLVMGHQVSLNPVVIAVGVTAGTFVAGLLGAVVVIPLLSICWEVYKVLRPTPDRALLDLPTLTLKDLAGTAVAKNMVDVDNSDLNTSAENEPSAVSARSASHPETGETLDAVPTGDDSPYIVVPPPTRRADPKNPRPELEDSIND